MDVAQTTSTGSWTITSVGADEITLTNTRTTEAQTVATTDGVTQTVDFDALGITLFLNTGYADGDFDSQAFVVSAGGSSSFQVGSGNTTNDRIDISLGDATATGLGVDSISFATASGAQSALDTIDAAISSLSVIRGNVGAAQNRLGYAAANLATTIENIQAAESVIRDVDMAAEMTQFTKNQILLQAGTAMLAQANIAPQQVLALFG
jgi:flagellin